MCTKSKDFKVFVMTVLVSTRVFPKKKISNLIFDFCLYLTFSLLT